MQRRRGECCQAVTKWLDLRSRQLGAGGPLSRAVKNSQDLDLFAHDTIRNQISCIRDDDLTSSGHASRSTELRITLKREQNGVNSRDDKRGSIRVIPGNEFSFLFQVLQSPAGPTDVQRIHLEKTCCTSSGVANSPRFASSRARQISCVCHSSNSKYRVIASTVSQDLLRLRAFARLSKRSLTWLGNLTVKTSLVLVSDFDLPMYTL